MQIADRFVERIGELEVGQGVVVRTRSGTVHRGRAAGLTSGDYLDGTDDATILRSARLAMLRGEHRVIDTARGHLLLYPVILASGEVVATVGMALEREMYGGVEALPDSWERLLRQQLKLWVDQVIREVAEARRQRLPVGAGSRPAPGRGPRGTDLPGRRNELSGHIDDVEAGARMGIEAERGGRTRFISALHAVTGPRRTPALYHTVMHITTFRPRRPTNHVCNQQSMKKILVWRANADPRPRERDIAITPVTGRRTRESPTTR